MPKKPDLSKFSLEELKAIIRDAEKQIESTVAGKLKIAKKAAEDAAKRHGFSLNEVLGVSSRTKSSKPKAPPKYKNPENPNQTWSGRGRQPAWFKTALEKGKAPSDFAI